MAQLLTRVVAGLGIGSLLLTAPDLAAQVPTVLSLRPFAAVANLPLDRQQVPLGSGTFTEARFSGVTMLGLEASVGWESLPIELRFGWTQTVGADIQMRDGGVTESCGPTCSRTTVVYTPIGGASVSNATMDFLISPFSWYVAPHAFFGVVHRRVRYSPTLAAAASLFTTESEFARRYGFGLDIRVSGRGSIRIEAAEQRSGMWLKGDSDVTQWRGRTAVLSLGAQIHVLGTKRR